jgi:superfamily II DNA or RNA helicase
LLQKLKEAEIDYQIEDKRYDGRAIQVEFVGKLHPEQKKACEALLERDLGVLSATTAFGKTVVGAALVAARKVNTLVLVHNTEIMKNWVEDFERFLNIEEQPPAYKTKTGRTKQRKSVIGTLYAGHDSLTGILDIAMIASLRKADAIDPRVKEYGMVIMDECHHASAKMAESVLRKVAARYVYGLTATPKRNDGHEKKIFMQLGPIRYRFTAKDRAKQQAIGHYIYPRFTRLVDANGEQMNIQDAYKLVVSSEVRNQQIVRDVEECLKNGRTPIVLTKYKEHAETLYTLLREKADHIFLLKGGRSTKEKDQIRMQMRAVPD